MKRKQELIDIHHHIVYGVDDGARDLTMSRDMIQLAASQGVQTIVCTSHMSERLQDRCLYETRIEELQLIANEYGIQLMPGAEVMFTDKTMSLLREDKVPKIAEKRVLCEFDPAIPYPFILKAVRELNDAGIEPVIAHAERYIYLRKNLKDLKAQNVVLQLNAQTAINAFKFFPDRWAKAAIKEGMIDIVASDAHDTDKRPCRLGDAYEAIERGIDRWTADELCRVAPAKLLNMA